MNLLSKLYSEDPCVWTFIDTILIIEFRRKCTYTFCFKIDKSQHQYNKGGDKTKMNVKDNYNSYTFSNVFKIFKSYT